MITATSVDSLRKYRKTVQLSAVGFLSTPLNDINCFFMKLHTLSGECACVLVLL